MQLFAEWVILNERGEFVAPWQFIFYQLGEFLSMTFLHETLTN